MLTTMIRVEEHLVWNGNGLLRIILIHREKIFFAENKNSNLCSYIHGFNLTDKLF